MAGNREYKSDVFSMLMENPVNALELYNAMNGSDYKDPGMVEMCRLDGGISLSIRNDAAFVLDMSLSIYEHQSTVCPNLPLRSLFYLVHILGKRIRDQVIYGKKLVKIPTPKFAVFYNGKEEQPERYELKLSDAFEQLVEQPELELKCMVYNINRGKNKDLMEKCSVLKDYTIFVDYVQLYSRESDLVNLESVINQAIDRCISENVLRDFLMEHRTEVVKVMTLDYTFERQLMLERREAVEDGRAEGRAEGRVEGRAEGRMEGELLKLIRQTSKKYMKNLSVEETADMLDEDIEIIRNIYQAIETVGSEDENVIYEQYIKGNSLE